MQFLVSSMLAATKNCDTIAKLTIFNHTQCLILQPIAKVIIS